LQVITDAELPAPLDRYTDAQLRAADPTLARLRRAYNESLDAVGNDGIAQLKAWPERVRAATEPQYSYTVRGREVRGDNYSETLSHNAIPKLAVPTYQDWGDVLRFLGNENLPGEYPFTAGVYPYRREEEDPIRMFAGEGMPERTNKRFHYLAGGHTAKRLSTAFDSTTLYGEDPDPRTGHLRAASAIRASRSRRSTT
jgi:methylmalonyl-CoA mutase